MDVIALAAAGIEDAVAPLGTALTEQQIELLWRLVERPDPVLRRRCGRAARGDARGDAGAAAAAARAIRSAIVTLPAGLDPDDLVKQQGAARDGAAARQARKPARHAVEHERDAAAAGFARRTRPGLKARLLAHVDSIQDADIKALYRRELLDRFSAFAFPPRAQTVAASALSQPRGNGRAGTAAAAPTISPDAAERLRRTAAGGARDGLRAGGHRRTCPSSATRSCAMQKRCAPRGR